MTSKQETQSVRGSDQARALVKNPFNGAVHYLAVFRRHLGRRLYLVLLLALTVGVAEGFGVSLLLPLLATLDLGLGATGNVPEPLLWILDWLGASDSLGGILALVGVMFLLKGAVLFVTRGYSGYLGAQLIKELKRKLFRACSSMSYRYYVSRNTGHFVNVLNTQSNMFVNAFNAYTTFLTKAIQTAAYLVFALFLAWQFGLMLLVVGTVLMFLFARLNTYVRGLSREVSKEMSLLNKLEVQALHAFKYLASTNELRRFGASVEQRVEVMTNHWKRQALWGAFTGSISEPIAIALIIGSIFIQVGLFEQPLAPILVAILFLYRAVSTLLQVQSAWQGTLNSIGAVEMVEEELETLSRNQEQGGHRKIGPLAQDIVLRHVYFSYSPEYGDALSDIEITIPAFSTVAVVGESGSGKSTLIDILTLLLKPREGRLLIDGIPGDEIELESWRDQIGYVSQETVVFDDTIALNIAMADCDPSKNPELFEQVKSAAKKAHLSDFIESLPEGYNTIVGDRGAKLSGGQRQRLFIARELFKQPSLLILDEATSALDSESELVIKESIDELKGKMTVVIIAHRLSTIRNVDNVIVLGKGRVIEQGTYESLYKEKTTRFSRLVAMQQL